MSQIVKKISNLSLIQILGYIILSVWALVSLFPLYWMITTSFKTAAVVIKLPPEIIPSNVTIKNYVDLFKEALIGKWMINSLIVSVSVTFGVVAMSSFYGYLFAKKKFLGREYIFWLFLATIMIPLQVKIIPIFLTIVNLKWMNTYWALIIPSLFSPFGVFLMRQFVQTLPNDLLDAAKIDGCSEFGIYWRIILPLSKPGLAVLGIMTFMGNWNGFLWPLIVLNKEDMYTLPVGLSLLQQQFFTDYGLLMAGATIAALPMFLIFFALQKYFIRGITIGALKG